MLKKAIWRALLRTVLVIVPIALILVGGKYLMIGLNWITELGLKVLNTILSAVIEDHWIFIALVVVLLLGSFLLDYIYLKCRRRVMGWMKQRERKKAVKKAEKEKKKAAKKAEKAAKKSES